MVPVRTARYCWGVYKWKVCPSFLWHLISLSGELIVKLSTKFLFIVCSNIQYITAQDYNAYKKKLPRDILTERLPWISILATHSFSEIWNFPSEKYENTWIRMMSDYCRTTEMSDYCYVALMEFGEIRKLHFFFYKQPVYMQPGLNFSEITIEYNRL